MERTMPDEGFSFLLSNADVGTDNTLTEPQ